MSLQIRLFLAAALAFSATAVRADVKTGDLFPPLSAAGLDGKLPVSDGRVVLVDFWASWCAPCRESFPAYAKLQTDYAMRGLVVVAVSVDKDPDKYARFVKKFHPPFATLRDTTQKLVSQVDVPTMPTCYLLGRDGRVRFLHRGFHGKSTEQDLRREIETLLAENPKPL